MIRTILAMANASRHPGVAIALAQATYPNQKLAAPAVFLYLLVSSLVSPLRAAWARKQQARVAGAARK